MAEQTDSNGLTETERIEAERVERTINALQEDSMRRIHAQSNQALARTRANILKSYINR